MISGGAPEEQCASLQRSRPSTGSLTRWWRISPRRGVNCDWSRLSRWAITSLWRSTRKMGLRNGRYLRPKSDGLKGNGRASNLEVCLKRTRQCFSGSAAGMSHSHRWVYDDAGSWLSRKSSSVSHLSQDPPEWPQECARGLGRTKLTSLVFPSCPHHTRVTRIWCAVNRLVLLTV